MVSINHQSNIKLIYTIYFFLLTTTYCYIKIPIKYYPEKIFNETNPTNTMHNLIMQRLYATLVLGTPKQNVQIPIEFSTNDFYISKSYIVKDDEKCNRFNIEYFNEELSTSLKNNQEEEVYYGVNFVLASKVKDYFYFDNKKKDLDFYLSDLLNEIMPGELGLQLNPVSDLNSAFDTVEKSFLKIIKNNGLTNNYVYTIIFKKTDINNYNNKEIDGYLYIGDYLHDIDKQYDYNKLTSINTNIFQKEIRTEFLMHKLIIYKNNNPKDIIKEINLIKNYLNVRLDYNFWGIQGSEIIRPYLEAYLFTKENKCYKGTFYYKEKLYFYYCEDNPTIIQKIKKDFPTIQFTHQDFNYDFIIKGDDFFVQTGEYIYCLMVFSDYFNKYEWRFGRPFLNKYIFTVDQDGKKILFYSIKNNVSVRGMSKSTSIILIIFLIIIFLIIGFIIARKIYRVHIRKKANVLIDDFEYVTTEQKYKKGSNIEMTKKLYTDD